MNGGTSAAADVDREAGEAASGASDPSEPVVDPAAESTVDEPPQRRWRILTPVAAAAIVVACGAVWSRRWLDLFPLVEFRQQIDFRLPWSFLWDNVTFRGTSIWAAPLTFNSRIGDACGTGVTCLNATLFGVVALTGALVSWLVLRLGGSVTSGAVAGLCWITSVPVMDAMAWQATSFDKLSALAVVLGIHVGLWWAPRLDTPRRIVGANITLLPIAVLASNAKPAAWVLMPALALLPIARPGLPLRRWALALVAPLVYAAVQNTRILRIVADDEFYSEHVSGGDPLDNLRSFLGYLAGSTGATAFSLVVTVAVVAGLLTLLVRHHPAGRIAAWLSICAAGALVIPIRTQYGTPFYMLVPQVFAVVAAAVVFDALIRTSTNRVRVLGASVVVAGLLVGAVDLLDARREYDSVDRQSSAFRASFAIVRSVLDPADIDQLVFETDRADYLAYKFTSGAALERFVFGTSTGLDQRTSDRSVDPVAPPLPAAGEVVLRYDASMNLQSIVNADSTLWTSAGGGS